MLLAATRAVFQAPAAVKFGRHAIGGASWRGVAHTSLMKALDFHSASMTEAESAKLIRKILTERRDGSKIFKMAVNEMTEFQKQGIILSQSITLLENEFEKADKNHDGVLTLKEFIAWGDTARAAQGPEFVEVAPSWKQLRRLFLRQIVPYMGFGFVDNSMMIITGDVIDASLCVAFGFSTMAAAALGNAFSNALGMGLHGTIESGANRLGLKDPKLTMQQMGIRSVQLTKTLSNIFGVLSGCLLGMAPLLFMDTKGADEAKKAREAAKAAGEAKEAAEEAK